MTEVKCIVSKISFIGKDRVNERCVYSKDGYCTLDEITIFICEDGDGGWIFTTSFCNNREPIGDIEFGV